MKTIVKDTEEGKYEGIYETMEIQKQSIAVFLKIDKARQQKITLLPGGADARTYGYAADYSVVEFKNNK